MKMEEETIINRFDPHSPPGGSGPGPCLAYFGHIFHLYARGTTEGDAVTHMSASVGLCAGQTLAGPLRTR